MRIKMISFCVVFEARRFNGFASRIGKAQEGLSKDAEFQALLAHVLGIAELTGRNITFGTDL